jgi:F-type H+-transporting ATPase subunit b
LISTLTQFATTEAVSGGVFGALGINWKTLILQIIAFLILVWLLGKFVYPWLMQSVDERQTNIEAATKAATQAQTAANDAQVKVAQMLKTAQLNASEIIATAKLESSAAFSASEEKAKKRAQQIVTEAQDEIAKEVLVAKETLYNETLELVAMATEKVVRKVVTTDTDSKLIDDAIKAVK